MIQYMVLVFITTLNDKLIVVMAQLPVVVLILGRFPVKPSTAFDVRTSRSLIDGDESEYHSLIDQ